MNLRKFSLKATQTHVIWALVYIGKKKEFTKKCWEKKERVNEKRKESSFKEPRVWMVWEKELKRKGAKRKKEKCARNEWKRIGKMGMLVWNPGRINKAANNFLSLSDLCLIKNRYYKTNHKLAWHKCLFVFSVIENTDTEKWMVILKEKRVFVHVVFFSYLVVPSKWIEEW